MKEIIQKIKAGDTDAVREIYETYTPFMRSVAARNGVTQDQDIEDVVQDSVIKLWRNAEKHDASQGGITWFATVIGNTAKDALRFRQRRVQPDSLGETSFYVQDERAQSAYDSVELFDEAKNVLGQLDGTQRTIFQRKAEGYSEYEIAESLGTTRGVVHADVLRARKALAGKGGE